MGSIENIKDDVDYFIKELCGAVHSGDEDKEAIHQAQRGLNYHLSKLMEVMA